MQKRTFDILSVLVVLTMLMAACTPAAPAGPAPAPTQPALAQVAQKETPVVLFEGKPVDMASCGPETRINPTTQVFEYRNTCGKGWNLILSHQIFKGGPEDPGVTILYISLKKATVWWQPLRKTDRYEEDWVAFYGDNDTGPLGQDICMYLTGTADVPARSLNPSDTLMAQFLQDHPCTPPGQQGQ